METATGRAAGLDLRLPLALSVRVAGDAAARSEGVGVADDRVKCRADFRVFQQTPNSHADDVVDAFVGREGECSQKPVLALWEPQSQSLQWLSRCVLHQCTMTEKWFRMCIRGIRGLMRPGDGGASTAGGRRGNDCLLDSRA